MLCNTFGLAAPSYQYYVASDPSSLTPRPAPRPLVALTEHLHKEMDGLKVRQLIVVGVDAHAEEEAGIPPVDDLVVAELDKVGLRACVSGAVEPRQHGLARPASPGTSGREARSADAPRP